MPLLCGGRQTGPGLHEREAEQVQAAPLRGPGRAVIIGLQPDAPDLIARAGFHQDPLAGTEQVVIQCGVLAELGDAARCDDLEAVSNPGVLVEASHLPPQVLGGLRMWGGDDPGKSLLVTEQAGLLRHHPVLSGAVGDAVDSKGALPPLAQTSAAYLPRPGRLMPPEKDVLQPVATLLKSAGLFHTARLTDRSRH